MTSKYFPSDVDIKLVVTDMDGTLLDSKSQLPEGFWQVLDELADLGATFVPASGRQYAALTRMFPSDKMGFIAENGNYVVYKGEEEFAAALGSDVVEEIVSIYRQMPPRDAGVVLCGHDVAYIERSDQRFLDEVGKYYENVAVVDKLEDVDATLAKVAICDFDSSAEVYPYFEHLGKDDQVAKSGPNWLDIYRQGVDKGKGLRVLQEKLGVGPENTVVFGDYHNDLPLYPDATYTFAVENAHQDIKDVARWVIPSNDDGGVMTVLEDLLETQGS